MKQKKTSVPLRQLRMASYTDGSLANVCWSPETSDRIADKVAPHVHSFYEIVFVESGSGSHLVNGARIAAAAGDVFLLGPGSSHDPVLLQGAAIWVFIFNLRALDFEGWEGALFAADAKFPDVAYTLLRDVHAQASGFLKFRIPATDRSGLSSLLRRIGDENQRKPAGWDRVIKSTLGVLLIELQRRRPCPSAGDNGKRHPMVALAMAFIDANFQRPVGLGDIAKHVDRSPAYLTDLVRRCTGRPVMAWLRDRRLVEARTLLLTTGKSIDEVAASVGYPDASHFSQVFKRRFRISPAGLRTNHIERLQ